MLALVYLVLMIVIGDLVCRRFYSFVSTPHRIAAAFLSGLVISSWFTYLGGLLFMRTSQPLLWGNIVFLIGAVGLILWSRQHPPATVEKLEETPLRADKWDWGVIGLFLVLSTWLMFSTLNMSDGKLQIANHQWSDFGPNIAIMQSFALGNNFPTEYPHFSGDRIRYHFLYYFQAGNLEYLGLNPALSNNILSILSIVSMLILIMILGNVLFRSRLVGWVGAALFFFHGSLSFVSYLAKQGSISEALNNVLTMRDFLPSGFPYRGEDWGVWSQVVFLNQRHLASSIGIFLLVFLFLILRYQTRFSTGVEGDSKESETPRSSPKVEADYLPTLVGVSELLRASGPYVFSGVLLGLMPLWNSAVFTAAFMVLGFLFVLFPLRKQMVVLGFTTGLIALPQVIFLKTGNIPDAGYSLFHWGYTVDDPSVVNVVQYLLFTFGFKWLLIGIALYFATKFQRKIFIAISSLFALAFLFQFSVEVLANHKFLNIWLIVANIYTAYGIYCLWNLDWFKVKIPWKVAAASLVFLITIGGILDLFPIRNSYWMGLPFDDDPLIAWIRQNTEPKAIFLTDRFVTHGILLAGRRVFHGHTYYTWGAGYPASERDAVYTKMFEERNPQELLNLLTANNISYVAIDNNVRTGGFIKNLNEEVYQGNFENVFHDEESKYNGLDIFKITGGLQAQAGSPTKTAVDKDLPPVTAFKGGQGEGRGEFNRPRGIAADSKGNFYVADSANGRIQKFSVDGKFAGVIGKTGTGPGELREPTGIAVDVSGNIYVTDATKNCLMKFKDDGTFVKQWTGPDPGFYGLRDVAFGPNKKLYILDQGRARVVRFDPEAEQYISWGGEGIGDGEFTDMTGITVTSDRVFVADAQTDRIQVFDLEGKFIGVWGVAQWAKYIWHRPDVAVDSDTNRIYITSGWTKEVLVFDMEGSYLESIKPESNESFTNPSSIFLSHTKAGKRLFILDTGSDVVETGGARVSVFDLGSKGGS